MLTNSGSVLSWVMQFRAVVVQIEVLGPAQGLKMKYFNLGIPKYFISTVNILSLFSVIGHSVLVSDTSLNYIQ